MGVSIMSVGMVTSLGLDWRTSCAAARSGIARAQGLQHYRIQGEDPCDVRFLPGHQVDLLTRGFEGRGRLLRLLTGAFRDLKNNGSRWFSVQPDMTIAVPVYLVGPGQNRLATNLNLLLEQDDLAAEGAPAEEAVSDSRGPALDEDLLAEAAGLADWPWQIRLANDVATGPVGLIELIGRCAEEMCAARLERAIVGAVDSLLDDETLTWLHRTGRLKTATAPTGLMPGEAAVLFLLDRTDPADLRVGSIESVALGNESRPMSSGQTSHGETLARVVYEAGQAAGWPACPGPWLISDHNGESYSASEWGTAFQRLVSIDRAFAESQVWFPAASFGDTGCARMAVSAGYALASWSRGYAKSSCCCIAGTSDAGPRGAAILAGSKKSALVQ